MSDPKKNSSQLNTQQELLDPLTDTNAILSEIDEQIDDETNSGTGGSMPQRSADIDQSVEAMGIRSDNKNGPKPLNALEDMDNNKQDE